MADRYARLYTLPTRLYSIGSPVIISAGALLIDNKNRQVVAQLKFQRISKKKIKALKVSISAYDAMGALVDDNIEYMYMDLNPKRDGEFGQKTPIFLKNPTIRSFNVAVTEVAFTDNSLWQCENRNWKELPEAALVSNFVHDSETIKQIRLEYGENSDYMFSHNDDLWYCICGSLNTPADAFCHKCHRTLEELEKIDLNSIEERKEQRLQKEREEEEKQRLEKIRKIEEEERERLERNVAADEKKSSLKKKTIPKVLGIAITAFLMVIGCLCGIGIYQAKSNPMAYVSRYIVKNGVQYANNRYTMEWMTEILGESGFFWGVDTSVSKDGICCIYEMADKEIENSDSTNTVLLCKAKVFFLANDGIENYTLNFLYKGKEYETSGTYDFSDYEMGSLKLEGKLELDDGTTLNLSENEDTLEKETKLCILFLKNVIEIEQLDVSLADLGFNTW